MAGSKSNYLENAVLTYWLRGNDADGNAVPDYTAPTSVYLGIHSTTTSDGTLVEIAASNYSATDGDGAVTAGNRPKIVFANPSAGQIQGPQADIEFDNTSGSSFTVDGFGIYDSASSGNLLYWGELSTDKTIADGDSIRFEASTSITISED